MQSILLKNKYKVNLVYIDAQFNLSKYFIINSVLKVVDSVLIIHADNAIFVNKNLNKTLRTYVLNKFYFFYWLKLPISLLPPNFLFSVKFL